MAGNEPEATDRGAQGLGGFLLLVCFLVWMLLLGLAKGIKGLVLMIAVLGEQLLKFAVWMIVLLAAALVIL